MMKSLSKYLVLFLATVLCLLPLARALSWLPFLDHKLKSGLMETALSAPGEKNLITGGYEKQAFKVAKDFLAIHATIYQKYDEILSRQNQSSSCFELAKSRLFAGCDTLGTAEVELEVIKSQYGVMLGICELAESGFRPPVSCELIIKEISYPLGVLQDCLEALRIEPQSWTSYSNHRKDASILCEVRREPFERAYSLQTFKSMLADLGVLVKAFSEVDSDLQKFKHKVSEIYSNLNGVFDAAVNAGDRVGHFTTLLDALNGHLASLGSDAEVMKASMLESLDFARVNKEHNAHNLQLSKTIMQQIINSGTEMRRQDELSRSAMERSARLKQGYLETLSQNYSTALVNQMDLVQQGLNELNKLYVQQRESFNAQQSFNTLAQCVQWLLPWLQSGWMSSAYLRPILRNHSLFMLAVGSLLFILVPSLGSFVNQKLADILLEFDPIRMAALGAAGGSAALTIWACTRSSATRIANRPQVPRSEAAPSERSVSKPKQQRSKRPHAWTVGGEPNVGDETAGCTLVEGRERASPYFTKPQIPRRNTPRGTRAVSLEPELCSYFRTEKL